MADITVLVVDDDEILRDGLAYVINSAAGLHVVGEAGDGTTAIEMVSHVKPDVVLMDIRMPEIDGIKATKTIKSSPHPPRVLVFTLFGHDNYLYSALCNGADGFLPKQIGAEQLCRAIKTVAAGHALIDPALTRAVIERYITRRSPPIDLSAVYDLTDREIDVLAELAAGFSNHEIAEHLHISEHTVKTHLSSIFAKTRSNNRVQAVIVAFESGLATPLPRLTTNPS